MSSSGDADPPPNLSVPVPPLLIPPQQTDPTAAGRELVRETTFHMERSSPRVNEDQGPVGAESHTTPSHSGSHSNRSRNTSGNPQRFSPLRAAGSNPSWNERTRSSSGNQPSPIAGPSHGSQHSGSSFDNKNFVDEEGDGEGVQQMQPKPEAPHPGQPQLQQPVVPPPGQPQLQQPEAPPTGQPQLQKEREQGVRAMGEVAADEPSSSTGITNRRGGRNPIRFVRDLFTKTEQRTSEQQETEMDTLGGGRDGGDQPLLQPTAAPAAPPPPAAAAAPAASPPPAAAAARNEEMAKTKKESLLECCSVWWPWQVIIIIIAIAITAFTSISIYHLLTAPGSFDNFLPTTHHNDRNLADFIGHPHSLCYQKLIPTDTNSTAFRRSVREGKRRLMPCLNALAYNQAVRKEFDIWMKEGLYEQRDNGSMYVKTTYNEDTYMDAYLQYVIAVTNTNFTIYQLHKYFGDFFEEIHCMELHNISSSQLDYSAALCAKVGHDKNLYRDKNVTEDAPWFRMFARRIYTFATLYSSYNITYVLDQEPMEILTKLTDARKVHPDKVVLALHAIPLADSDIFVKIAQWFHFSYTGMTSSNPEPGETWEDYGYKHSRKRTYTAEEKETFDEEKKM